MCRRHKIFVTKINYILEVPLGTKLLFSSVNNHYDQASAIFISSLKGFDLVLRVHSYKYFIPNGMKSFTRDDKSLRL